LSLLWMPAQAGTHSLSACVSGDAAGGAPWKVCSEAVRVVAMDLSAPIPTAGIYVPQTGDSLDTVAQKFGLPPVLLAAANPQVDPAGTLNQDTPVNIPSDPSLIPPSGATGSGNSPWTVATVKMSTDQPIDKGYCYYSFGANYWTRVPAAPQTFVYPVNGRLDLTAEFRSLTIPPGGGSLAMECWGWSGSAIVPLGSGKTEIKPGATIIQLQGDQFAVDATLDVIPGNFETRGPKPIIPPPQALTSTSTLDVCIKHMPPADFLLGPWDCKVAVERSDIILIWDWIVPYFPPDDPKYIWLTKIDGFHVYEVGSAGKRWLIKTVSLPEKKVLILKRSWIGSGDFMVRAYAGPLESADSNIYTLRGTGSGLATVIIAPPSAELFGGREKHKESVPLTGGPCSESLPSIVDSIGSSKIAVGYEHYEPEDSCLKYYWEYSRAQVVFQLGAVKGPVSSAKLSYRQDFTSSPGHSCARRLDTVTTTTSGVDLSDLASTPFALLPTFGSTGTVFNVNVTDAVRDWMLGTPNAGFLFRGIDETLPDEDYEGFTSQTCWTRYSDLKLTVTFFLK
jgi:LysM repeat protein